MKIMKEEDIMSQKKCNKCGFTLKIDTSKRPLGAFTRRMTDIAATSTCCSASPVSIYDIPNPNKIKSKKQIVDLICPKCGFEEQDII